MPKQLKFNDLLHNANVGEFPANSHASKGRALKLRPELICFACFFYGLHKFLWKMKYTKKMLCLFFGSITSLHIYFCLYLAVSLNLPSIQSSFSPSLLMLIFLFLSLSLPLSVFHCLSLAFRMLIRNNFIIVIISNLLQIK